MANHRCAVLGKPVAHSLSPVLHNAAYRSLKLDDWLYDKHEVGEDDLDAFLKGLDSTWAGLSLTMPLKKTIQPYGVPENLWAKELKVANTAVFDWSMAPMGEPRAGRIPAALIRAGQPRTQDRPDALRWPDLTSEKRRRAPFLNLLKSFYILLGPPQPYSPNGFRTVLSTKGERT